MPGRDLRITPAPGTWGVSVTRQPLFDHLDDAARARFHQHGLAIHQRVAIGCDAEGLRNVVIGDAGFRQHAADDYAILNEDLVVAVSQVAAILEAEARRVSRQDGLPGFIDRLRRDVIAAAARIGTTDVTS